MGIESTYPIASDIVAALETVAKTSPPEFGHIRTIFVCGSFVRGDWLDCNSDLDIGVIFREGFGKVIETSFGLRYVDDADKNPGYQLMKNTITEAVGGRNFHAQTPGGIDMIGLPEPPRDPKSGIGHIGPPMFHVFLFDFLAHHRILFGEKVGTSAPNPAIPHSLLLDSLDIGERRIEQIEDNPVGQKRATFLCWRLIQKSQCHFGEATLDKTRILYLFRNRVPDFASKQIGDFIIRQYLGTYFPERPTFFCQVDDLTRFHLDLTAIDRKSLSET